MTNDNHGQDNNTRIFDKLPIGFVMVRLIQHSDGSVDDLLVEYLNPAAAELLAADAEALVNNYFFDLYPKQDRVLLDLCEEAVFTDLPKEHSSYSPIINKYIHFHVYKIADTTCGILMKDITASYTVERMYEKQAVTLQRIYDTMETGIFQILNDPLMTIVRANQSAYKIMGYTRESFIRRYGTSLLAVNYEEDISLIRSHLGSLVLYGAGVYYEHRIYNSHNEIIWIHSFIRRTKSSDGQDIIQIEFRNCTRSKQLQLLLENERERYRLAMKNSKDIIFEYDIREDRCLIFGSPFDATISRDIPQVVNDFTARIRCGEIVTPEYTDTALAFIRGDFSEPLIIDYYYNVNGNRVPYTTVIESVTVHSKDNTAEKIVGKARIQHKSPEE